ncbi:hypothetical protein BCR34DRAFT_493449 [Clohesyomyces aquaticus]|uniref:Vacuolar membrane-associated protein IML1 n=1 Tax=Clohesyomyces aquaticus TaxID=1231657 RepID=A0A1Y1YWH0_9PLEO|nr:hypothetical protein BCR34DRAFT_493449 [Clohesyomyces aquaticus]
MSKSVVSVKHTRVQKICTLWTHDDNFSRDDVVFNGEKFPEFPATPGSLIQILALAQITAVRDFQSTAKNAQKDANASRSDEESRHVTSQSHGKRSRRGSLMITLDENGAPIQGGREVDVEKSYIFVAKPLSADLKSKHPNLQISLAEKIARVFGFRNRMQIVVTSADEDTHSASHVEITFRDEYLARADMWRMSISELSNRTVYRGQKLLFMGTIKATIKNVYINGSSTHSGYFSSMTKPVFRSESARYVLFIQMSKEMWDFDAEGAGEIMFNRVVNGFLPDLFKRWMRINARHLVTIILFTRMEYDRESSWANHDDASNADTSDKPSSRSRDYYRVVVSDMASGDWIKILYQLKKEFRAFLADVSLVPKPRDATTNGENHDQTDSEPEYMIAGKPSPASRGNILEAINLAAVQFAKDYIDRDLVRTGISVVVVTAGTGVFEVDYNMLKLTTDTLIGSGIGIDLVCLSPMPLHSVPLFKYRSPRLVSGMRHRPSDRSPVHGKKASLEAFDEQDDKTPRQHQPNFGSVVKRSPALPPPVLSSDPQITPPIEADEWRYAMPHWVDISFWSGPSDEIIELSKPRGSTKSVPKSHRKGGNFALRCRMYELQMMGVMENELGDIAIPYLEEEPFYPQTMRERLDESKTNRGQSNSAKAVSRAKSASYSSKEEKNYSDEPLDDRTVLHLDWMETYDEHVFSSANSIQPPPGLLRSLPQGHALSVKAESPEHSFKSSSFLSSSLKSMGRSVGKTVRPQPETNIHPFLRERSREVDIPSPRGSFYRSPESKAYGVPRADVLLRQQSSTHIKDFQRADPHRRGDSGESADYRRSMHSTPNDSPAVSRGNTPPERSVLPPLPPSTLAHPKKADTYSRPASWFLRQISFGSKGRPVTPTTDTATSDITMGEVEPARLTVENNLRGAIAAKLASTKVTDVEKPSQPIAIRTPSRAAAPSAHSPADNALQSVETVRGAPTAKPPTSSHPSSMAKDLGSTFLLASRAQSEQGLPKMDIASSGGARDIPSTLSPTSALAPWAVLVNPCNPKKNNMNIANQFRRWQHVFPKRLRTSSVKWKSLCSPAAVPLTNEYFPTPEQIATEYNENPYKIAQNEDDEMMEVPKSRESLIRELIAFRLSHGFQIVVSPAVAEYSGRREHDLSNIFHPEYMSKDGDTVFMCVGNAIHQLVCVAGGEVEVRRFSRKPTTALQSSAGIDAPLSYRPLIRTALEDSYQVRDVLLQTPRKEYNWNFIDTFLAGYHDELDETLRFWRARFVLIPVELPTVNRRPLPLLTEDSEEEIRLEGIRKLTQLWQKNRYIPPEERSEERHFQATTSKKQKDPNPLAIEYHTRDPSVIVAAGPDSALLPDGDSEFHSSLFTETDQYHTSNIDLKRLAEELQGERGIQMLDRRWHWRLHYNCFIGFDLTSWLQSNFKDIDTRDEAVDLGNQLMEKGLFQHVQKRHQFRDGNFFYQIAADYRASRPESRTSWFGMRKSDRSVPSTPMSEGPRSSPLSARSLKSRPSTGSSWDDAEDEKDGEKTPTRATTPKRSVTLSRVMRYDVDSRKRSYRPEIISLHYDRLHNPDNCYHIRIDWMNVTAKLIEDSIVSWATNIEKYGLKLVEVPIAEASNITSHHPFRSPYTIKLALQPPKQQPEQIWDTAHFSPQAKTDKFVYHKALLRKLNFVLDMEAADCFPADVNVTYSWGKPDYKSTQFIHRSGTVLAQITNEGSFLLLANRLAHNRAKDNTKFRPTDPYEHKRSTTKPTPGENTGTITSSASDRANAHRSPFASPLARPVQDSSLLHTALQEREREREREKPTFTTTTNNTNPSQPFPQTPEQIKDEIEAFCADAFALKTFYDEALRQAPSPSPRITPVLDNQIPSLGLPPAISIREASPASGGGWMMGATPGMGIGIGMTPGKRQGSEGSVRERDRGSDGGNGVAAMGAGAGGASGFERVPNRQDSQGSAGGS